MGYERHEGRPLKIFTYAPFPTIMAEVEMAKIKDQGRGACLEGWVKVSYLVNAETIASIIKAEGETVIGTAYEISRELLDYLIFLDPFMEFVDLKLSNGEPAKVPMLKSKFRPLGESNA